MSELVKKYIKREIFNEVTEHIEKPEMTLITGPRQVGKTTLIEQLKNYLIKNDIDSADIFSFNLDIIQDWEAVKDQTEFIRFLKDRSAKKKIYVFIDEAQKVSEAGMFFKGIFDSKLNVKLILTGSASFELKSKLKESLSGRKMVFNMVPFTFYEFLTAKDNYLAENINSDLGKIDQGKIVNYYKEYITYGGYPRVVLSSTVQEKINILKEIYSSYIEKDVLGFLAIKNKTAFSRLLKLLSAQVGQLVNIKELAMNLEIDRQTVERYILTLEQTFIIKKINPFFINTRQEIIKMGKIYFLDLGIRNLVLENFNNIDERVDKGLVLENSVFNYLSFYLRNFIGKIRFWRMKQGSEVDFVIEKEKQVTPIEIKYKYKQDNIVVSLKNFINKFDSNCGAIVNLSDEYDIEQGDKKVSIVYPFHLDKFLKNII